MAPKAVCAQNRSKKHPMYFIIDSLRFTLKRKDKPEPCQDLNQAFFRHFCYQVTKQVTWAERFTSLLKYTDFRQFLSRHETWTSNNCTKVYFSKEQAVKKLILFITTLFVVAACQQDNSGGTANPGTPVVTPLSMSCINGTAYCNNSAYTQHYGWLPYPGMYNYAYDYTNHFNQYGFCNCPSGYMPVYNGTYGLGCVNTQILEPYQGVYFYWQWGQLGYTTAAPQATTNFPQYSNIPGTINSAYNCSRTLTQSCLLDQGNTCGTGATCRQVFPGSNLGVCIIH